MMNESQFRNEFIGAAPMLQQTEVCTREIQTTIEVKTWATECRTPRQCSLGAIEIKLEELRGVRTGAIEVG